MSGRTVVVAFLSVMAICWLAWILSLQSTEALRLMTIVRTLEAEQPKAEAEDHASFIWGDELTNAQHVRTVWKIRADGKCYLWFESRVRAPQHTSVVDTIAIAVEPVSCE